MSGICLRGNKVVESAWPICVFNLRAPDYPLHALMFFIFPMHSLDYLVPITSASDYPLHALMFYGILYIPHAFSTTLFPYT